MVSRLTPACRLLLITLVLTGARSADVETDHANEPRNASSVTLVSSSSSLGLSKAPTDTFYLYGGPGTREGKFEGIQGVPLDRQGWIGVDLTDHPIYWQVSEFNAANLGGHGAGNLAAWSGQSASQQPGWATAPGYGNGWNDMLEFHSGPLIDPTAGQTVGLDFVFNYDLEPGYDYFNVEYYAAGTWVSLLSVDGSNRDSTGTYATPGTLFSSVTTKSIVYAGNDYGGPNGDEVVIRLRVNSDEAWSDEDGLWPTAAGAAQVDDISVSWSDGSDLEDFESGSFFGRWQPQKAIFAGDFSKVWPKLEDGSLDPCSDNDTHVMGFIDAGQEIGNAASAALIPGYPTHTSGATSPDWTYGPGGWVTSKNGGVSNGLVPLKNEVWSPPIAWDLPGSADDGADVVGAVLRSSVWAHLPLGNGIFYVWSVRATTDGSTWLPWRDDGFVYYGGGLPRWRAVEFDVSRLLPQNPVAIQIALGVEDWAAFFWGLDSTPSPFFDNVTFLKYRVGGPVISMDDSHLANDGFPVSGSIDVSSQSARDALDIPLDMARNIDRSPSNTIDPGDSLVADVISNIPGAGLADLRLAWVLDRNPLFDDVRSLPSRSIDENVSSSATQWFGEVVAESSTNSLGVLVPDRYFFDLPDQDFFYPGDVLRYYLKATDTDGRTTTLPEDTAGFTSGDLYASRFTVHGLPSLQDSTGAQPWLLIWDDSGDHREQDALRAAMLPLALYRGYNYDTYTTLAPANQLSNGLGSAGGHGATASQLSGYEVILYSSGERDVSLLTDPVWDNDRSNDLSMLRAWHALPGRRAIAYIGSYVASADDSPTKRDYLRDMMNVIVVDNDVRDVIEGQFAPKIRPIDGRFWSEFLAYGWCPGTNQFDQILPGPGATRGHGFVSLANFVYDNSAASIIFDRIVNGDQKIDITIPIAFSKIYRPNYKAPGQVLTTTRVLVEILYALRSGPYFPEIPVPTPEAKSISMQISPNPFNPRTTIRFAGLPENAAGSVKVYSLRGELVTTLADGEIGRDHFTWEGRDARGRAVASGVYLVKARVGNWSQQTKIALLK